MVTGKIPTTTQQMDKVSQHSSSNGRDSAVNNLGDVEDGFDVEYERKLVRKLDRHIVPMVMLLYLFSFLDRYVILEMKRNLQLSDPNIVFLESTLGMRDFTA